MAAKYNLEMENFKWYSVHISDSVEHDGTAVIQAIKDVFEEVSLETDSRPRGILLKSDNASHQFK